MRERGFWTQARLEKLNILLWAAWDPIGAGVPVDEYEIYAPTIAARLEAGATADELARELTRIASQRMGVRTRPKTAVAVAEKLVDWYEQELRRADA